MVALNMGWEEGTKGAKKGANNAPEVDRWWKDWEGYNPHHEVFR